MSVIPLPEIAEETMKPMIEKDGNSPTAPENASRRVMDEKAMKRHVDITVNAAKSAFTLMMHTVFRNPPALAVLQETYNLFHLRPNDRGAWVVNMTADEALRLHYTLSKFFNERNIADAIAEDVAEHRIFDWSKNVSFLSVDTVLMYHQARMRLELLDKANQLETPEANRLANFCAGNLEKLISVPQTELRNCMMHATNYERQTQITITVVIVDTVYNVCCAQTFILDVQKLLADQTYLLKDLMLRYFIENRNAELRLAFMSGERKPLPKRDVAALRRNFAVYARCTLYANGMGEELKKADEAGSGPLEYRLHAGLYSKFLTATAASICGYCGKDCEYTVRCKGCNLFRYCDEKCRALHATEGIIGAKEEAEEMDALLVTHSDMCLTASAVTRMWAQFTPGMNSADYAAVLAGALETFEKLNADKDATTVEIVEIPADVATTTTTVEAVAKTETTSTD